MEKHDREAAGEYGRRPLVARRHLGLGEMYRKAGRRTLAHEHLVTATTMLSDMRLAVAVTRKTRGKTLGRDTP